MLRTGLQVPAVPFLRLLIPLCIGIGIFRFHPLTHPFLLLVAFSIVLLLLIFFKDVSFRRQTFWGMCLLVAVAILGFVRASEQSATFPPLSKHRYFAVLEDFPREKEKTIQLVCQLLSSGRKVIMYLPKLPSVIHAKPGELLCFDGLPELMENEGNPFEFDYCSYLHSQNIGYRIFLKEKQFYLVPKVSLLNIQRRALILRQKLIEILYGSGIGRNQVHLIASISFGARDDVDKETIQNFTNTGVIHVLAVSGMNVGLVFVVLDFFLRFLKPRRAGRFLHLAIVLVGIWAYSLITGMSPSILRAATMFSFVLVGNALHRNTNIFNSLAVSAFLLLAWDPSMMWDTGFQLSYAAVLAIVLLQPAICGLIHFRLSFIEKIWELLSVTLAAQFGTLPITLYYFHQFPVYFWLANLLVIPLVTLILYLSFVVIFFSWISGFITGLLAVALDGIVRLVLFFVNLTANLPQSVIRGLYPSVSQIIISTLLLVFFYGFYRSRKFFLLQAGLILLIWLAISLGFKAYERMTRSELVFFNIPGARVLVITRVTSSLVLYDSNKVSRDRMEYYLKPYFGARGIRKVERFRMSDSLRIVRPSIGIFSDFIFFEGNRIFIPSTDTDWKKPMDKELYADLVWLQEERSRSHRQDQFLKSKIILFRTDFPNEKKPPFESPQKGFILTKAVQLYWPSKVHRHGEAMSCRYFLP